MIKLAFKKILLHIFYFLSTFHYVHVIACMYPNILPFFSVMLFVGAEYKLKVHFCSEHAGFYEHLLVFKFKTHPQASDKMIMRLLEVIRQTSFSEEPLPTATNLCDLQTAVPKDDGRYVDSISCYR